MLTPASFLGREVLGKPSLLTLYPPQDPVQGQMFWKGFLQTRGRGCLTLSGPQAQAPPRNPGSLNGPHPGFNTGSGQTLLTPNPPSHPHTWIALTRNPLLKGRLQGLRPKETRLHRTLPPHTRPEYRRSWLRPRSGKLTAAQTQQEGDVHNTGQQNCRRLPGKEGYRLPSHRGPRILRGGARGAPRRILPPHTRPASSALTSWKPGNPESRKPAAAFVARSSALPAPRFTGCGRGPIRPL